MKVTGFTFIRNAITYDYPVLPAILSMLPLCDEVVVAVGKSADETRALIASIHSSKIKIIDTIWDDSLREGGRVLALETDKAYMSIDEASDWCIYLQADEVLHEKDYDCIRKAMEEQQHNKSVDGLLFHFLNFYGSYEYVADSYGWHQHECRVLRKRNDIYSNRDALGFRKAQNKKLDVLAIDAGIYHYGWVRPPATMQQKTENFHRLWHTDHWIETEVVKAAEFDYSQIDSLQLFTGTHPLVIQQRILDKNWHFNFDPKQSKMKWKYRLRHFLESNFGWHIGGFRNWRLIR